MIIIWKEACLLADELKVIRDNLENAIDGYQGRR